MSEQMIPKTPQIAGELTPQEQSTMNQMRNAAQQIVHRIGSMEVEKNRLMSNLFQQEQNIQMLLGEVGNRLGIPKGTGWQVAGDKAVITSPAPEPVEAPKLVEAPESDEEDLEAIEQINKALTAPEGEEEPVTEE